MHLQNRVVVIFTYSLENPTMINCLFYTKIDSAVPYNSAAHLDILNIQYIVRAKINFKSILMLRSGHLSRKVYRRPDAYLKKNLKNTHTLPQFTLLSNKQISSSK